MDLRVSLYAVMLWLSDHLKRLREAVRPVRTLQPPFIQKPLAS